MGEGGCKVVPSQEAVWFACGVTLALILRVFGSLLALSLRTFFRFPLPSFLPLRFLIPMAGEPP
jgi:hypothetical protein